MRKFLLFSFGLFAVLVAIQGLAAFGLLMWDFMYPGTFKEWYIFRGGMPLNLILLLIFGLQHSLMAREGWKKIVRKLFPVELERSTYVLFSGFTIFLLAALWSPSAPPLYDLHGTVWGFGLMGVAGLGVVIILISLITMDGLELLGIRSLVRILKGVGERKPVFRTPFPYNIVRHPLYLGMLMLFWATPAMTHDHLFFAEVMTAYVLLGIWFEERDMLRTFGEEYANYRARVPMLIPFTKWRKG